MTDFQLTQELNANKLQHHPELKYTVGKYVLLARDVFYTGGKYLKLQPFLYWSI